MIKMLKTTLEKILENSPLAIIILGLLLIVLGALGGLPYWGLAITEMSWRITLAIIGVLVALGGGTLQWRSGGRSEHINVSKYGFKITFPSDGELVDRHYTITGVYKIKPPEHFTAVIIDIDSKHNYRPRGQVIFGNNNTWRAQDIYSGHKAGIEKTELIALVGPAGKILCDYYESVGKATEYKIRPPIGVEMSRIINECDRVRVVVRTPA